MCRPARSPCLAMKPSPFVENVADSKSSVPPDSAPEGEDHAHVATRGVLSAPVARPRGQRALPGQPRAFAQVALGLLCKQAVQGPAEIHGTIPRASEREL